MYGFGDVSAPVEASVEVLEDLVCEFILTVVANAMANSKRKGSFKIEDLLFVLRSDRKKYLRIKVIKHASFFSLWRVLLSCHHAKLHFLLVCTLQCIGTEVLNEVATPLLRSTLHHTRTHKALLHLDTITIYSIILLRVHVIHADWFVACQMRYPWILML